MEFEIEPEVVYVLDKNENLITIFKKDDEDTIINPKVTKTQNKEATFSFSIAKNNLKWNEIKNPENLYLVEDKIYSTNFEGCFDETLSENNEDLIVVTAYERQKLLSRKYVRAWNSETGFENIDTFMVVVLSKGILPLVNNGNEVHSTHPKGTSGYALDALLYGTGWQTGICDVEGTFDLETDQIDIYENIFKVQQIWGGILVFDSLNKIIHHRDETKFLPYNGYEVKYQKNMQSLEQIYNNKIITKLAPLGEGGLNIKKINNGSEWITNFSYTDSILEGIENNPDITEPEQLKRWGERKLQDLCKPRKELTVQAVLLHQLEGYELETIDLNDIVDVLNYQYKENEIDQLRVVGFEYSLWQKSDAILELSDITLESTDIFKKSVQATNEINNGTLNSNKVVVFYKNGRSLNKVIYNIDETIVQTKSELTKADDAIRASVTETKSDVDNLNNEIIKQQDTISGIDVEVGKISASVKQNTEANKLLEGKVTTNQAAFEDFKTNEYMQSIGNLQDQIDGAIQFWNGAEIPTLNNYPANMWITENDKINHTADIYTVIKDIDGQLKQGKGYRFDKVGGVWQWVELTDNELSAVQAIADEANKRSKTNSTSIKTLEDKNVQVDLALDGIKTEVSNNKTEISNSNEVIGSLQDISKSLGEKIDLNDAETLAKLEQLGKDINLIQTQTSTNFEQTNKSFEFQFNELIKEITVNQEGTNEKFNELKNYIRFEQGNIILGKSGNPLTLTIQNDRISYKQNGTEIAYFSNNQLYVPTGIQIGKFAFIPRDNGSLSFRKVVE